MSDTLNHLTAAMVADVRVTEAPRHNSVSGYGPKIPTRYMLRIANRWHRVYIVQYSNSGSAYVVYKGADYYLDSDVEHMLSDM